MDGERPTADMDRGNAMTKERFLTAGSDVSAGPPQAAPMQRLSRRNNAKIHRRRLLGSYYTPEGLAKILVRWALARGTGSVS